MNRDLISYAALSLLALSGCGLDGHPTSEVVTNDSAGGSEAGGDAAGGGLGAGGNLAMGGAGGGASTEAACTSVTCSGHGSCVMVGDQPACECDSGYEATALECVPEDPGGTLLLHNGFESGSLEGWRCSGNCSTATTSTVAAGKYAGNFVLTRDLSVPYRTEVVVEGGLKFSFGKEYLFSLDYRHQDWAYDSDAEIGPFQVHTTPSTWSDPTCGTGSAVGTAPFLMLTQADETRFITYGGNVLWKGPLKKKTWSNIKVRFIISSGNDGFIEAWRDGQLLGRVDGPNNAGLDGCSKPQRDPYFKMGVYKWNWKSDRPATESTRRQLLLDDLYVYDLSP